MNVDLYDILVLAGLVSLAVGLWWIWPPLALVVVGALLLIGGVVGAKVRSGGQWDS